MEKITLTKPDDLHVHVRDGDYLRAVVPELARRFARAIIMPNLTPPVTTVSQALAYRERIFAALAPGQQFQPLLTLYLTDNTPAEELRKAAASGVIHGVKLYPAGATTNSDAGVTDIGKVYPLLEVLAETRLPLLIHGEVTDREIDIFDREQVFIDRILAPLTERLPELRIVLEHITSEAAATFIGEQHGDIAATITAHHLLFNRNDMLAGGIRPHMYCLPILKLERDRQALLQAATSGNPRFFLGTDSAPHGRTRKECACGCAGIYTGHNALELYAEAFAAQNALPRLEAFASHYGADFYGLPRNRERVTLLREEWQMPEQIAFGADQLIPLRAGGRMAWRLADNG